jgi:hypothetical protein
VVISGHNYYTGGERQRAASDPAHLHHLVVLVAHLDKSSRLVVDHWKFELNLIPYGGSM